MSREGRSGGLPRVAVIGRSNVGKSTLVNRLLGRREAIAHEQPGVTRDRLEKLVEWAGRSFVVIDTGGFVRRPRGLEAGVVKQAARAAETADLSLLVVEGPVGIMEDDEAIARELRRIRTPVLVAANKIDTDAQEPLGAEFYALGLGEPIGVSALHGRGTGELLDRVLDLIPDRAQPELEDEFRVCLVGRPNVGKSSLFNRLVREERALVHEEPGTTRDAVDTIVESNGRSIRFVDTAGLRRPGKARGVEYYGLVRSLQAIDQAHVALLVVDAWQGLTAEDKRIAARTGEAGRGLVAALNKWDLVPSGEREERFGGLKRELELFPGTPVVRTSALTGAGVGRLIPALLSVEEAWTKRVGTSEVNQALQAAVSASPPPRAPGRIRYATQVSAGPPTFVLFGSADPGPSYRRYLENFLRRRFRLDGVPVRLVFRAKRSSPAGGRTRGGRARGRRSHPSGR